MRLTAPPVDRVDVDWAVLHRDLADVYERHGMAVQANVHRRLALAHAAARSVAAAKTRGSHDT
jgi:hypothetical protein